MGKKITAGERIAVRHAKFPDGRVVYGPNHSESIAKAIDAAIRRAVKEAWAKGRVCEYCMHVNTDTSKASAVNIADRLKSKYGIKNL